MKQIVFKILEMLSEYKWDILFFKNMILDHSFREAIQKEFFVPQSDKCYIIGNGPSAANVIFSKLNDSDKITVNNIVCNDELFLSINPNFHVIIDPVYYDENSESFSHSISMLQRLGELKPNLVLFTIIEGKDIIEKYNIHKLLQVKYLYMHGNLHYQSLMRNFSFCSNIPSVLNVSLGASLIAMILGYKEIVLLGCEMTSFYTTLIETDDGERKIENQHAYTYSMEERTSLLSSISKHNNEFFLRQYADVLLSFQYLHKYALKHDIVFLNATKGGILDALPRMALDIYK